MPLVLRPARAEDAELATPLLFATGPANYLHTFGLGGNEPRALAFIARCFRAERSPLSHRLGTVAEYGGAMVGLMLDHPAREKGALERAMVSLIAREYRVVEWPAFVRRGLQVQAVLGGVPRDAHYLAAVAVAPEQRGRGVGTTLMRNLFERVHASGAQRCALHVGLENRQARALYEGLGFQLIRETPPGVKGVEGQACLIRALGANESTVE